MSNFPSLFEFLFFVLLFCVSIDLGFAPIQKSYVGIQWAGRFLCLEVQRVVGLGVDTCSSVCLNPTERFSGGWAFLVQWAYLDSGDQWGFFLVVGMGD